MCDTWSVITLVTQGTADHILFHRGLMHGGVLPKMSTLNILATVVYYDK